MSNNNSHKTSGNLLRKYVGVLLFVLSFLIFVSVQTYLVYAPIRARLTPVDGPVAFGYILKAEQMNSGCFLQDCPALVDLRMQLTEPAPDFETSFIRAVEYHRVFVIYHPLHSLVLAGLENAGLTYEQAYDLLALLGKLLICAGIAYWLYVIYGRGPTTIALLLLTPLIFVGQGLHSIVPSNMALGISLFLWAIILQRNQTLHWTLIPLLVATLLMHQIGRLYALIAVGLYFCTTDFPLSRRDKVFLISGLALIGFTFVAPMFITNPELSSDTTSFYPGEWNYLDAMIDSIGVSNWPMIEFLFRPLGSVLLVGLLVAFYIIRLRDRRKKVWLITASLLVPFLIFSIVYVDPWYGPLVFERAWVPTGIFLTGALGLVVFVLGRTVFVLGRRLVRAQQRKIAINKMQPSLIWWIVASFLFAIALKQLLFTYIPYYATHYELTLAHQIDRLDFRFDASQPELLRQNNTGDDQTIVYMNRDPFYYYLGHGGQDFGALYYPALVDSQLQEQWVKDSLERASFLVAVNPIYRMQNRPEMEIEIDDNAKLSIEGLTSLAISSFQIFALYEGRPVELKIEWHSQGRIFTTTKVIPDNTSGWMTLSQDEIMADQISITVIGNRGLRIRGISFEDEPLTNWPWVPGIVLTLTPEVGDAVSIELSEARLFRRLPIDIEVIDDDGITILARVLH